MNEIDPNDPIPNDPNIVRIELGPLRVALERLAERGMEHIDDVLCEQISAVFRVALVGLSPEQCAGVYAAMLLKALPEVPTNG